MPFKLLSKHDFTPKPATEAAESFGRKIAVPSDVFDRISAEAKSKAFRIAGVHKARLVQRARDIVKKAIEEGTPFPDVRRALTALFAKEDIPRPSLARLRLTFQQNAQQAYNDSRRELLDDPEITSAFPFRQYLTVGNGTAGVRGVRPEHAALHNLVFRWDDPFWDAHTPPWDYGCRCTFIALTPGQVKRRKLKVRNLGFVRKQIKVAGQRKRGIDANAAFVRGDLDLSSIDKEIRKAVEELL